MSAADKFKRLFESDTLHDDLSKHRVEWRLITYCVPWYGRYWEYLIGLTKKH